MTLQQLHDWANSAPDHIRQIALTREAAKQLLAEIEAKDPSGPAYEIPERDTYGDWLKRSFAKQVQFDAEEAAAVPYPTRRSVP